MLCVSLSVASWCGYNLLLSAGRFKTKDPQTSSTLTITAPPNCLKDSCILSPPQAENSYNSPFCHSNCHTAAICSSGPTLWRAGLSSASWRGGGGFEVSDSTGDIEETEQLRRWSSVLFWSFLWSLISADCHYFWLCFKIRLKWRWAGLSAHQSTFRMIKLCLLWGQVMNHEFVGPGLPGILMRLSSQHRFLCLSRSCEMIIYAMISKSASRFGWWICYWFKICLSRSDCWRGADTVGFPAFRGIEAEADGFALPQLSLSLGWRRSDVLRRQGHRLLNHAEVAPSSVVVSLTL